MNQNPPYRAVLERVFELGLRRLENIREMRVSASVTPSEATARMQKPLQDEGLDPLTVVNELAADASESLIATQGGRFFAWVIGGSLPAALGADVLATLWDQNAALFATSPAHGAIEEACGIWMKELLGIPESAGFAITTGTQMAHVTALAAARSHLLHRAGWDVETKGLMGAPTIEVITGAEAHGTLDRAIRLLGMGTESVKRFEMDDGYRLSPAACRRELEARSGAPIIVHLEAGSINTGAYDHFAEIIPMAHEHGAWVHIDGAIGLWAKASPKYQYLLEGSELADSWSADGHKWLNVPYDSGYAFVRHAESQRAAMSYRASYLAHDAQFRDQMDYNPEWSRRGRGAATYAAIRELGRNGVAAIVEETCRHTAALVAGIGQLPGAVVVIEPVINQGLVRFVQPATGDPEKSDDSFTDRVVDRIVRDGEAFFQATTFLGQRCMRISLSSWMTDDRDVERSVAAVAQALETCGGSTESQ